MQYTVLRIYCLFARARYTHAQDCSQRGPRIDMGDEQDSDSSSSSPRAQPGHHEGSHVVHIGVGRYNLGGLSHFAQCTRLGRSGGMILAKLSELARCRISGEEVKTRGAPAPGAPCFLRQWFIFSCTVVDRVK